ncbi:hypothetical protein AB0907_37740 [Streptomyces sp. NPDC006975]|uniref:hypothetical protein n=1 Tax=Streptomyces sp. NPDC006975 TaxID=3154310 RepID=UPI0034569658
MPNSLRRRTAALRRRYTGELSEASGRAVRPSRTGLGLDDCSPQQQRLRALLALGWFNTDPHTPAGNWCAHGVFSYTLVPSPRHDSLVLYTNSAWGVVCWLVPGEGDWPARIPGLRFESGDGYTWRLRHLPTGSTLIVTEEHDPGEAENGYEPPSRIRRLSVGMTDAEYTALEKVPDMSPAATRLLGALAMRVSLRDPSETWAVGGWFSDPLDRTPGRSVAYLERRLNGAGDEWELAWTGYPFPDDLAAALTHPTAGLPDTSGLRIRDGWALRHGSATLRLCSLE